MFGHSKSRSSRHRSFEEAFDYAIRLREDLNIMQDEQGGYHVIRLFGVEHWSKHYKTVTEIRMVPEITGKQPQSTQSRAKMCNTPCSDAAGTCLPQCPNLRKRPGCPAR